MSPVIILFGPPRAPFTEKCRRGLAYKGMDYEFREPDGVLRTYPDLTFGKTSDAPFVQSVNSFFVLGADRSHFANLPADELQTASPVLV